jgi:putative ABC transport system permease protein
MALWQDLRYAVRMTARNPGFALLVILVLALGLGTNSAIFSLVDEVLLRPLSYRDPARLVLVARTDRDQTGHAFSRALLHAVGERASAVQSLAGFQYESFNLTTAAEPERLSGMVVTANLFSTLGVEAQLGRTFVPGEDQPGAPRVVILSHALWTRRFASDPQIVGRSVVLNGQSCSVAGVMPAWFRFDRGEGLPGGFDFSPEVELWAPLQIPANDRGNYLLAVARIRSGLTFSQAQAQMDIVARQLERERAGSPHGLALSLARLDAEVVQQVRSPLLILLGAVGLLLLIACANVANLLLSRATARKVEFSIRVSLGAGRFRLARQLIAEYLVYALVGGAIGLTIATWALNICLRGYPSGLLRVDRVNINWQAAIFCFLLSLCTGVVFGLAPLLTTLRVDLNTALKRGRSSGGGREGRVIRQWLVGVEVALAFVLLVGAGLLVRSFLNILAIDPGFQPERVLTAQIDLPETKYPDGPTMVSFFRHVLEDLRARPEVEAAGVVTILPLGGLDRDGPGFNILGRSESRGFDIPPSVTMPLVSAGYFQAMGIPLREGRFFTDADTETAAGAAIINEACARRWFQNADAVGQQLSALGGRLRFTIVGVVADVRHWGLETAPQPMIYVPYFQVPRQTMAILIRPMTLVVRGSRSVTPLASLMRGAVQGVDREQPISNLRTMSEVIARSLAQRRLLLTIMMGFALAALMLAMIGIYAVVSYSVAQRTGEIGIRMALGARPATVLRMILGQSMLPAVIGLGAGLSVSLACARVIAGLLYGVRPTDTGTLIGIMAVLASGTLLASYRPAKRAAELDPLIALKEE